MLFQTCIYMNYISQNIFFYVAMKNVCMFIILKWPNIDQLIGPRYNDDEPMMSMNLFFFVSHSFFVWLSKQVCVNQTRPVTLSLFSFRSSTVLTSPNPFLLLVFFFFLRSWGLFSVNVSPPFLQWSWANVASVLPVCCPSTQSAAVCACLWRRET